MATEEDFAKLASKLKLDHEAILGLGVQPQSWFTTNDGFVVIHGTAADASKVNAAAGHPVLTRAPSSAEGRMTKK